ncbi:unnamed protein product [Polarella glacialis]|uniref:Ribosome biogenesis protein NOP53 n=1 Tax=Polarella glacialis TaxID=89957 RepID=A0A813DML7_POLGL|nr:unnamed protein product [Polarella glacialis]
MPLFFASHLLCLSSVTIGIPNENEALESLSFPKPDDEPWRRTPDILVSEDVSPIFLQLRLATAKDTKKLRKAVPKAMPAAYYSQSQNQNQGVARGAGRRRLYADDPGGSSAPGAVAKAQSKAKAKASNGIALQKRPKVFTEEEIRKRQRRTDRFGPVEVQRVAETPQTGARPVKDVVAALALRVASGQLVHSGPAPVGSGPAVASSGGGQIGAADTTAPAIRAQALTTVRPVVVGVAAPRLATELEKRNKRASRFAKEDAAKGTADVPAAGGQTQESSTVTSTAAVAKAFGRRQRISVENECEEHVPACKAGTKVGRQLSN